MAHILYIAHQPSPPPDVGTVLQQAGHTFVHDFDTYTPELLLLDLRFGEATEALVERASSRLFTAPVIVLAGTPPHSLEIVVNVNAWVTAPFEASELTGVVRAILAANLLSMPQTATERIAQAERERDAYARADQQKDEFISYMSHELKNPMASIKGYADLMRRRLNKTPDDPNWKGLEVISAQVGRMNLLLDQLLDFSRISMDRLQLNPRPVDLVGLTQRVVEDMQPMADHHALLVDASAESLTAIVDANRIQQAIQYVVSNAIKFSPEPGTIVVAINKAEDGRANIAVRDKGIGIPEADQPHIFERFYRASNVDEGQSGLGLGLFLASELVARHGGMIELTSEEKRGSTFTVVLPLAE